MFTGGSVVIQTITYTWSSATEDGSYHTDVYTADNSDTISVSGRISNPLLATVAGNNVNGFLSNGSYFDAIQVSDISWDTASLNMRSYQGATLTTTYSLDSNGQLVSQTVATYNETAGGGNNVTVSTGADGVGTISGSESGFKINGSWYVNYSATVTAPIFSPPTFYGVNYNFTYGSYSLTYQRDGSYIWSEQDTFQAGNGASCTISGERSPSGVSASGSISGNDPTIGSYFGTVTNNVSVVDSPRSAPSFATGTLWNASTPLPWVSGNVDQSGVAADVYRSADNSLTVMISGSLSDRNQATQYSAQVAVFTPGGNSTGTYDCQAQTFSVGFDLQVKNGTRTSPSF